MFISVSKYLIFIKNKGKKDTQGVLFPFIFNKKLNISTLFRDSRHAWQSSQMGRDFSEITGLANSKNDRFSKRSLLKTIVFLKRSFFKKAIVNKKNDRFVYTFVFLNDRFVKTIAFKRSFVQNDRFLNDRLRQLIVKTIVEMIM